MHPTTVTNVAPADHDLYRVFALQTGAKIGQFQVEGGTLCTVIGTRAYYVVTHPSTSAIDQRQTVRALFQTLPRTEENYARVGKEYRVCGRTIRNYVMGR